MQYVSTLQLYIYIYIYNPLCYPLLLAGGGDKWMSPHSTPERSSVPIGESPGPQSQQQVARDKLHEPPSQSFSSPTKPSNSPPQLPGQPKLSESGFSSIAPSVSASAAPESPPLGYANASSIKPQVTSTERTSLINAGPGAGTGVVSSVRGTGSSGVETTGNASPTDATGLSAFGAAIAATGTQAQEALAQEHAATTAEAIVETEVNALFETDWDSATPLPLSFDAGQTPAPYKQPTIAAALASAPFERTSSTRNSRLLGRRRPGCASVRLGLQADPSGTPALRSGNARLSLRAGPFPQSTAAISAARGDALLGVHQVQSLRRVLKDISPASGVEYAETEEKEKNSVGALSLSREVDGQRLQPQNSRQLLNEMEGNSGLLSQSAISGLHLPGDSSSATSVPNGDARSVSSELDADRSASQLQRSLDMTYYPSNSLFPVQYFLNPE